MNKRVHNMPDEIAAEIKSIGKVFNEEVAGKTREIYMPLLNAIDRSGIDVTSDISYGPHERNILDVHVPENGLSDAPTVIFFHGGGYIRGHKNVEGDVLHGNVANFFVRNGIIGVNATYRLAPEAKWPDGATDVGAALAWARDNIADYGGNPDKIFLLGQSAGANHVATYVFRKSLHPSEGGPSCAGAILMSGVYGQGPGGPAPNHIAYFGEDSSKYAEMVTLGNVEHGDTPVMMSNAEFDPIGWERFGIELLAEIATKFDWVPRYKQMQGHNHVSQVYSIGTGDNGVGPDIIDFIDQTLSG
ncbi:MAG: alpha/beta hydrolase [Rhodospirillaceae bacterium]|nr:alpha/beta hydrolase [Rhodospirillaceae bacterium]